MNLSDGTVTSVDLSDGSVISVNFGTKLQVKINDHVESHVKGIYLKDHHVFVDENQIRIYDFTGLSTKSRGWIYYPHGSEIKVRGFISYPRSTRFHTYVWHGTLIFLLFTLIYYIQRIIQNV